MSKIEGIQCELRGAIEPWNVLGEESTSQGTARYVDSSVERIQIKVKDFVVERYVLTCNGVKIPLIPTGIEGEFVSGMRYRAWQPWSALHPTIGVDTPLTFDVVDGTNMPYSNAEFDYLISFETIETISFSLAWMILSTSLLRTMPLPPNCAKSTFSWFR